MHRIGFKNTASVAGNGFSHRSKNGGKMTNGGKRKNGGWNDKEFSDWFQSHVDHVDSFFLERDSKRLLKFDIENGDAQ